MQFWTLKILKIQIREKMSIVRSCIIWKMYWFFTIIFSLFYKEKFSVFKICFKLIVEYNHSLYSHFVRISYAFNKFSPMHEKRIQWWAYLTRYVQIIHIKIKLEREVMSRCSRRAGYIRRSESCACWNTAMTSLNSNASDLFEPATVAPSSSSLAEPDNEAAWDAFVCDADNFTSDDFGSSDRV